MNFEQGQLTVPVLFVLFLNSIIQKGEGIMKIKNNGSLNFNQVNILAAILGTVCSILVSVIMLAGLASLFIGQMINENFEDVGIFLVRAVSVLIGVLCGTIVVKNKPLVTAGLIILGYLLILIVCSVAIYDGVIDDFVFCVLSVVVGGGVGLVIRLNLQNSKKSRRKTKR